MVKINKKTQKKYQVILKDTLGEKKKDTKGLLVKARKKLEKHFKDSKPDIRVVEVIRGNAIGFLFIPDTPALFKSSVIDPCKQLGVKPDKKLFDDVITKSHKLLGGTKHREATPAQIKKVIKQLEEVHSNIFEYNLDVSLHDLDSTIFEHLEDLYVQLRTRKKQPTNPKYDPIIVKITKGLIDYWQQTTGSKKKISAYNIGNTYGYGYGEIDVKHNSGGAFLQRTLKNYFSRDMDNLQLKRLLEKVNK